MTLEELIAMQAKAQEQMGAAVKALQETITARFAAPAKSAEADALVEKIKGLEDQIKALQSPAVRKMVFGKQAGQNSEGAEVIAFNRFLKAVLTRDESFLKQVKAPNGQSETAADGGYAVPYEYANEIVKLERTSGIIRSLGRVFPMGSVTRYVPRELAKPTVYWAAEGTEPTALSKGTLDRITQTAKKLTAIVPFTEEILEDNNVSYDSFIAEMVALQMSREEDKVALVGDVSGLTDAYNGVYFTSGVGAVTLEGASLSYADLVNLLMDPAASYRARGQFVLNGTALMKIMKLVDDHNKPIWTMPESGNPGRLLGKPYVETDQIPDTLGTTRTNGANTAIMFGAWDGVWISPLGGYTVKASDSASDSSGKNAFTQDEVWFKFRRREAITVVNPEALSHLTLVA